MWLGDCSRLLSHRRHACCFLPREAFVGAWHMATSRNASIKSNLPSCRDCMPPPHFNACTSSFSSYFSLNIVRHAGLPVLVSNKLGEPPRDNQPSQGRGARDAGRWVSSTAFQGPGGPPLGCSSEAGRASFSSRRGAPGDACHLGNLQRCASECGSTGAPPSS